MRAAINCALANRQIEGHELFQKLESEGISIRTSSYKGLAEEAPEAYKNVSAVVQVTDKAGLATSITKLAPLVCIKG